MSKYGEANTVTGQAFIRKQVDAIVTALPLPVVPYGDLALKAKPINIAELSGKQAGAMVLAHDATNSKWYIAVAQGSLPTAKWSVTELETPITPAA